MIENLEQELNLIQTEMEQCGSDYVKLQTLTDRQQETSARLEERMERWAELTEMAEAMQKHGGNQ
ncbi:MAG: ABC transporter C-terminal domain-containing protein [Christensenellales bacterium]